MPTYQFICRECEEQKEIISALHEQLDTPECYKCGMEMKRNYGLLDVQFKGTGFYSTDKS